MSAFHDAVIIEFLVAEGVPSAEINYGLAAVFKDDCLSEMMIALMCHIHRLTGQLINVIEKEHHFLIELLLVMRYGRITDQKTNVHRCSGST